MTAQLTHPQRETLESFGLGKLADDQANQVEQHLAECPACCETLLELQNDTFVELVRTGRAPVETIAGSPPGETIVPPELADHPRYHVLELLGRGGMGEVYRAEHKLMNRPVAIKVVNRRLMRDAHAAERFSREVQAAARLAHPNIVTAYDAEQAGDLHFLAMEFVDGIDLAQLVTERGPLPANEACEYIRQAAEGLQHAYERGMVHRDIKPQNLMLVQGSGVRDQEPGNHCPQLTLDSCPLTPVVKILDFGLARFAAEADEVSSPNADRREPTASSRLTSLGATMGTPDYIAPEQSRCARDADIRSDIYSLGCTLYFLLAGRPPFTGSSQEKLAAHANQEPPPLSDFRDNVPPGLQAIVSRMMAKEPHDRYQTPKEVAAALECGNSFPLSGAGMRTAKAEIGDKSPHSKAPSSIWRGASAIALLAAAFLVLLGAVFYIKLGETTVKFEIEDPTLAVRFGIDEITIDNDGRPIRITPGDEQTFTVMQDGLEARTTSFKLRKGDKVVLKVSIKEGKVEIAPNDEELALDAKPAPDASNTIPQPLASPVLIEPQRSFAADQVAHASEVAAMSATADRRLIVTSHIPGTIAVWDASKAKGLVSWSGAQGVTTSSDVLAVSSDGAMVAQASGHLHQPGQRSIRISQTRTGELLRELENVNGWARVLAFSPDNRKLLAGGYVGVTKTSDATRAVGVGPAIQMWDIETGREIESLEVPEALVASPSAMATVLVYDATFSADGKLIAAVGAIREYEDERVTYRYWGYLWESKSGRLLHRLPASPISRAAFSLDHRFLIAAQNRGAAQSIVLQFLEVGSGALVAAIPGHLQFSDIITGRIIRVPEEGETCHSLDISPDGRFAATVSGRGTIRVWDLRARREVAISETPPELTQVNETDVRGGKVLQLRGERRTPLPEAVCFLRDSRSFVTGGGDGVKLWRLPKEVAPGEAATIPEEASTAWPPSDATPPVLAPALTFRGDDPIPDQPVQSLQVAANGQRIAASHAGGELTIWDPATYREIIAWKTPLASNRALAISPDGRFVAAGDQDRKGLQIWNATTGELMHDIKHDGHILDLAFSTDGSFVVAAGKRGVSLDADKLTYGFDSPLRLWSVETGKEIKTLEMPDWMTPPREKEAVVSVGSLAISPDGKILIARAIQTWRDGKSTIRGDSSFAWDINTGKKSQVRFRDGAKYAFAADGLLITASDFSDSEPNTLRAWKLDTGVMVQKLPGHDSTIIDLQTSPDGELALSIDLYGSVRVWNLALGKQIAQGEVTRPDPALREALAPRLQGGFLADGRSFVTSDADGIKLWRLPKEIVGELKPSGDHEGAKPVKTLLPSNATLIGEHVDGSAPVVGIAMVPDRQTIFTAHVGGIVAMSDLGQKREVASWQTGVNSASVLSTFGDGKLVAVGAFNGGRIEIWDAKERVLRSTLAGHSDFLRTLALAPDGRRLVSGAMQRKPGAEDESALTGDNAPLRVWDVEEGVESDSWEIPELLRSPGARTRVDIDSARFSRDGSFLAVVGDVMRSNLDGSLQEIEDFGFLWDAGSGAILRRLDRVKTHATTVAFSPDETLLVTGHAGPTVKNCVLRVWDATTGNVLREMAGHNSPIMFLDVSPEGDRAVSVDARGELRVWRLADGENIALIAGRPPSGEESSDRRPPRFAAAFLADGQAIVTTGMEGVKLWTLPPASAAER